MLVVPTQTDVTLQFSRTWVETVGGALTAVAVIGLTTFGVVTFVRRRRVKV
jgi:hypothetical protein